jgi:hypothetical protein
MLVFTIGLICIVFAKDSYINKELRAYEKVVNEPWLDRIVALKYKA